MYIYMFIYIYIYTYIYIYIYIYVYLYIYIAHLCGIHLCASGLGLELCEQMQVERRVGRQVTIEHSGDRRGVDEG